jgi:chromosome segregation ATPase
MSKTSRNMITHYRDEDSYVGRSQYGVNDHRYMATIHPIETRTTLIRDKGFLSPTRKLYDTGIRADGTNQTIIRRDSKRSRTTRHASATRGHFGEELEVRGTRPSKFAEVRSSKYIKVSKDTPHHREQLKTALKRLIGSLDHKSDDLIKDTENRLKILEWLFRNKDQYDSIFGGGGENFSEQQTLVSEIDREYSDVYKLDQEDLFGLRSDVERMREELRDAERMLQLAKETRDKLLRFFGKGESDDLEIEEEEIIEDEYGNIQRKTLLNRYVRRTDREVQEIRDENQTVFKRLETVRNQINQRLSNSRSQGIGLHFNDIFREIQTKLNGTIGSKEVQNETLKALNKEYINLVDKNIELKNHRIQVRNEIETVREFLNNDRELKRRLEESNLKSRGKSAGPGTQAVELQKRISNLQKEKQDLERQLKTNYHRIRNMEEKIGADPARIDALDRLIKRLENSLQSRNDAQNTLLRSANSNVRTIEIKSEAVGSIRDDNKVQELLDQIERKEKEINQLLDLQEQVERKRRIQKRKSELSYNLGKDIQEMEKKAKESNFTEQLGSIEIDISNKEYKISDQEKLIDQLQEQIDRLMARLEGPGVGGDFDEDDEREYERLQSKLEDLNRKITAAKRSGNYQKIEQKKKVLREKEEYIEELQRQLEGGNTAVYSSSFQKSSRRY